MWVCFQKERWGQYGWSQTLLHKAIVHILNTHIHTQNSLKILKEGIPNDGIPIEDVVTVSLGLTVLYVILATAGMAFSVVCLLFNLIFRQKRSADSSIFALT